MSGQGAFVCFRMVSFSCNCFLNDENTVLKILPCMAHGITEHVVIGMIFSLFKKKGLVLKCSGMHKWLLRDVYFCFLMVTSKI